jgi:UDP-N-acetylmuramate--alanine ligase
MIGIGGISMSGIAEILHHWGITVTGSDASESEITEKLQSNGITVHIGTNPALVEKAKLVIHTAAIKQDHPELIAAKYNNIPIVERSDFVGYLTKIYKDTIGVSGTHGKTTTTSMLSVCFLEANYDPTIQVGGLLKQINGNYRIGNSEYFILEACEYVESFLKFSPKSEIVLNIDNDHLDYFINFDNIKNAFIKYANLLPEDGSLVLNADDENCLDLRNHTKAKVITYGINNKNANYIAKNISFDDNGFAKYDVYYNNNYLSEIKLSVPGMHNVSNSLACIALCLEYKISRSVIKSALLKFTGTHRRFEYIGEYNNVSVFDDYGHHPTEISATLSAMKNKKYNKSWVIFQPHTYSRTANLLEDFADSLSGFDNIIVTNIYAAREKNTYGISSEDLVKKINSKYSNKHAIYIPTFSNIAKYLKENISSNDIVLTLGAGTIRNVANLICK